MTVAQDWSRRRSHHHAEFPADAIRARKRETISVCLPGREVATTIGPILDALLGLRDEGVLDQVVVVDAGSCDGTAEVAERAGAEVHQEADLMPGFGLPRGKGDAMWRALSVLEGDIVVYLDSDSEAFGPHFACGLVGPLVSDPAVHFVKAFYRRPFRLGDRVTPDGGGRVTELTARPLLNLFWPELAGLRQPLSGEVAARRWALEQVPFATGYAVEIAMLVDVYRKAGLEAIAQVDLDVRQNSHQSLADLYPMAAAVLQAAASRLAREGRLDGPLGQELLAPVPGGMEPRGIELVERPPMASLRATA
ncbi:MAG: glucosyl-3-phosphoglycerate synthase [Solirubrobacteraceae bacterium]